MKLLKIAVSGWQCFADRIEVGPLQDGLNVIHAPNGTGKSTLFGALRRAFFDGYRTGGETIAVLQPWGRDLSPAVAIEFEHGGTEYRLEKQFLSHQYARLQRKEGARFVALSEAEKADEALRAMFQAGAAGRGSNANKPDLWGLAQVLWVPQSRLTLGSLAPALSAQVQAALGAQVSGEGGTELEEQVEERFLSIFTPTGQYRTGQSAGKYQQLSKEMAELETRRRELVPQVQEMESAANRVKDLQGQRQQSAAAEKETEARLAALRLAAKRYQQVQAARDTLKLNEESLRQQHEALRKRIDAIRAGKQEIEQLDSAAARLTEHARLLETQLARSQERLQQANAAYAETRGRMQTLQPDRVVAGEARDFVEYQKTVTALATRLDRYKAAHAELEQQRARLAEVVAPSSAQLNKIQKADHERRDLKTRLDASLITLQIIPLTDAKLNASVAEQAGSHTLSAGEVFVLRGSPEVAVEVPGFGQIRASGPVGSVEDLREELARAEANFEKQTRPFGTGDLEELRQRVERAGVIQQEITRLEARCEAERGDMDESALSAAMGKSRSLLDKLLGLHPEWADAPPDPHRIEQDLQQKTRQLDQDLEQVEKQRSLAIEEKDAADRALQAQRTEIERTSAMRSSRAIVVEEMEKDGLDPAGREARSGQIALEWKAAEAALAKAASELDAFPGDPADEAEREERRLTGLREQAKQCVEDEKLAEGRLQRIAQSGAYSRLAEVEEGIAATNEQLQQERLRSEAVKLLRETVVAERQRAVASVAGPVESLATDLMRRIGGARLGRIRLGEHFGPDQVRPTMAEADCGLDLLSGGESEQVHLAVRLALADVLCRIGNHLLVLDDVLVATDDGRLTRIQAILEEFASRLQIVILTCHPSRYRGIRQAHFVDLERIVQGTT